MRSCQQRRPYHELFSKRRRRRNNRLSAKTHWNGNVWLGACSVKPMSRLLTIPIIWELEALANVICKSLKAAAANPTFDRESRCEHDKPD